MKKVLSLVLVIAMVLSSMSFAFAGTLTDIADSDYKDAINTLVGLGIIDGYEDGTFRPERTVTRAQMAKMLVITLGYGDLVTGSKSNFADTQGHWADAYIALAAGQGLVVGYPNGTFRPDKEVSYDEAMTMVVRALGYTDSSNEIVGTWPTNYKIKAAQLGLTDDVKLSAAGADRGGVAQLLKNSLSQALVKVDTDGNVSYVKDADDDNKSLLSRLATKSDLTVSADNIDADSKNYKGDIVDLTPYMYQKVVVYENKDGDVVYVDDVKSLVFEGTATITSAKVINVENDDEDEYDFKVVTGTALMINGEEVSYTDALVDDADVIAVLDAADDDKLKDNLEVVGFVATKVTDTVQLDEEYVEDEVELIADVMDVLLPVNDDDEVDFDRLTITGDATTLEDIKEDDVLTLYYAKGSVDDDVKLKIVVTRNTVEGKITKINSDGDVTIDGTSYELGELANGVLSVGDEVILYLDHEGDIYASEELDALANNDYALVVDVKDGFETSGGVRLAEPKVKLLTATGEKITYVLDDEDTNMTGVVTPQASGDLKVNLADKNLVTYNINKDGEVDKITVVTGTDETNFKTVGNSFNLASNVVIFSSPTDVDDAKVVDASELDDEIDATVVYDGPKIVALVVTDGVGKTENTYGVIVNNTTVVLDEDEDTVIEYTVFVDGEEVTYLGESSSAVSGSAVNGKLVKLSLDGGKLDGVTEVVTAPADDIKVESATAKDVRVTTYITKTDDSKVYLTDDVVVYVVETDGDIVEGSKSDIRGNAFVAYNLSTDVTNDYEIVVVFE